MIVGYSKCKEILNTLPIGYYLKTKTPVTLSQTSKDTYVDMGSHEITISYPSIVRSLEHAPVMNEAELEEIIRGLLYHEISHLILTHQKLLRVVNRTPYVASIVNIFEDERIETLLRAFYRNVNFRKNIERLNLPRTGYEMAFSPEPLERFYAAVRYRIGPKVILDKINETLHDYAHVRWNTDDYIRRTIIPPTGRRRSKTLDLNEEYIKDIMKIYEWFCQHKPPVDPSKRVNAGTSQDAASQPSMNGNGSAKTAQNDSGAGDQKTGEQSDEQKAIEQSCEQEAAEQAEKKDSSEKPRSPKVVNEGDKSPETEQTEFFGHEAGLGSSRDFQSAIQTLLVNPEAAAIQTRVEKIIRSVMNRRANQSTSNNGYAGRIDPRLCGNRDYKWFIRPQQGSSGNKFSKIKFNLFVDNSGSFRPSRDKICALIQSLIGLEDQFPAFKMDVVTIDTEVKLRDRNDRYPACRGGSDIKLNLLDIYKHLQAPDALTANIAVFDGGMHWSEKSQQENKKAWSAFDHPNCIVVSDTSNEQYIREQVHSGKQIFISEDYANKFIDIVLANLERLLS